MKILAFAATNSSASINRALVTYAASLLQSTEPDASFTFLDLNDFEMTIYSTDREKADGIPDKAQAFFDEITKSDGVLVSFAEHNGFVTSAWKNIFDWVSRIDMQLWQGKPIALLAATPGPRAGANVLGSQEMLTPFFGGTVVGSAGVGAWPEAWDAETASLTKDADRVAVQDTVTALIHHIQNKS